MTRWFAVVVPVLVALACSSVPPPQPATPISPPPGPADPYGVPPAAVQPTAPRVEDVVENGATIRIEHGVAGQPAVVGCADGQREAFHDLAAFPDIAGCLATWPGALDLRAPATGRACGDEIGACAAAADACAPGWHVCSSLAELRRVSAAQCEQAGGGRFSAATSHCRTQSGCETDGGQGGSYPCFARGWCSEPVCCGLDCGEVGACPSGVWPEKTHIPVGTDQGCGAMTATRAGGILCCRG